ncbi:MAG TPA: hypothetical protein VE775_09340 [Pyrinomonadaceae bacterium]|nr:hypothetical protein [Pyrinomonadaceae bacterium]
MQRKRANVFATALRCVRLRCPVCGRAYIAARPFRIRHHCPQCRALFQREEGFFVGALSINVVTTELVLLLVYYFCLLALDVRDEVTFPIVCTAAVLFPVAFYHHSWSIWLSLDHLVEGLPAYTEGKPGGGGAT